MRKLAILFAMPLILFGCKSQSKVTMEFETVTLQKKEQLFPQNKSSLPSVEFDIQFLYPKKFKNEEQQLKLQQAFQREVLGKDFSKYTSAQESVEAFVAEFLKRSREPLEPEECENLDTSSYAEMYHYEQALSDTIIFKNENFVSISTLSSSYMGGAHGMFATYYVSIDLNTFKKVELKDLFVDTYEEELAKIIRQKLVEKERKNNPEESEEDVKDHFFEFEKIKANDNFMLKETGIEFNYTPYEIAAFAFGEHRVEITYKELKSLLKPDALDKYIKK